MPLFRKKIITGIFYTIPVNMRTNFTFLALPVPEILGTQKFWESRGQDNAHFSVKVITGIRLGCPSE